MEQIPKQNGEGESSPLVPDGNGDFWEQTRQALRDQIGADLRDAIGGRRAAQHPDNPEPTPELCANQHDYEDIIKTTRRLQGNAQGDLTLSRIGSDVRDALVARNAGMIADIPAYAALAFRGCLRLARKAEVTSRAHRTDYEACLAEVRATGTVGVAESARPAWSALVEVSEQTAWAALVLIAKENIKPSRERDDREGTPERETDGSETDAIGDNDDEN
jgi:hypothetical protein